MANKGVSGSAVLLGAAGIYFIYAGIKDISVVEGLRLVTRGQNPSSASRSENKFDPFSKEALKTELNTSLSSGLNIFSGGSTNQADWRQVPGTGIRVHKSIVQNVNSLIVSARGQGINLDGSGGRDSQRQAELRIANGCPDFTSPSSTCRVPTAPVGHSQHELGLAIDFTVNGATVQRGTRADRWLLANAGRFGLKNLPSEAWHYSTTGK